MAPRKWYPVPDLQVRMGPGFRTALNRDMKTHSLDSEYPRAPNDFATKTIRFENKPADDANWEFQEKLGSGAFGLVGLWNKKDANGDVIDELVVKETFQTWGLSTVQLQPNGPFIPEEAVIQVDLQRKRCAEIVQMRGLSVLTFPPKWKGRLRFYMEYCHEGDLEQMLNTYVKAAQADRANIKHIPEQYLWHLLHAFAKMMLAMEQRPFDHPWEPKLRDPFVLHLDVKFPNIMLDTAVDDDIIKEYPSCKVGDWGLACLTSLHDSRNSGNWSGLGTPKWHPPEQRNLNSFGRNWTNRPHWSAHGRDYPYRPTHSVFAFASVMFRLMTLDQGLNKLEAIVGTAEVTEVQTRASNYRVIRPSDMDEDYFLAPTGYSDKLRSTIADCLHLDAQQRMTASQLEPIANDMCTRYAATQYKDGRNTFPGLLY